MLMKSSTTTPSDVAIFGRLLSNGTGGMSRSLARYVLTLGFTAPDQQRMAELAARNQDGAASAAEREELQGYVKAGHLLALLQSRARQTLNKKVS